MPTVTSYTKDEIDLLLESQAALGSVVVSVDAAGATDYTAEIQAALNTGADVVVAGHPNAYGIAKTTATLTMNQNALGQRFSTSHAYIAPAFVGDAVQVTTYSELSVYIRGDLQPATGDYSNVAMIRVGSATYNPQQGSIARSSIRDVKGNGVIWDGGAMIDFTGVAIYGPTYDGIRCSTVALDNNHGNFANTHVVSAAGRGYAVLTVGTTQADGFASSRHHVFTDAKAFGCGQNFHFETESCVGSIFSELGKTPDAFTATSRGNSIEVIETAASFEGFTDAGLGNRLSGYSVSNTWDTKEFRVRTPTLGSTRFSAITSGQYTIPVTTIASGSTATFTPGVTGLGTGRVVNTTVYSATNSGTILTPHIDASGNLRFQVINLSGSSRDYNAVVSYVVWQFA